jgi:hypothetical protein
MERAWAKQSSWTWCGVAHGMRLTCWKGGQGSGLDALGPPPCQLNGFGASASAANARRGRLVHECPRAPRPSLARARPRRGASFSRRRIACLLLAAFEVSSLHSKRVFAFVHDQRWSLRVFEARLTARCCRCCGCANSLWGNSPPASSMTRILFRAYLHRRSVHPGLLLLLLLLLLLMMQHETGRA